MRYSGILNQESQTVDADGRVHVLNRENTTADGVERWYHYWKGTNAKGGIEWTRVPFPLSIDGDKNNVTSTPTVIGKRGKLVSVTHHETQRTRAEPPATHLLAILPSNAPRSNALTILHSTSTHRFRDWTVVWQSEIGCGWEPLFDRYRLDEAVLSLYLTNGGKVEVVDLSIGN